MRFYVFLLLMLIGNMVFGQEESNEKRAIVIGGSVNAIVQKNSLPSYNIIPSIPSVGGIIGGNSNEYSANMVSVLPYIGKELGDNWLMGLELGYVRRGFSYETVRTQFIPSGPSPVTTTIVVDTVCNYQFSNAFRGGVFERFTINPDQKLQFFTQFNIVYTTSILETGTRDLDNSSLTNASYIDLSVDLGANYALTEKWRAAIWVGALSYFAGAWEENSGDKNKFSSFNLNFDPSRIRIGVECLF